jgi:hypothetical protein
MSAESCEINFGVITQKKVGGEKLLYLTPSRKGRQEKVTFPFVP